MQPVHRQTRLFGKTTKCVCNLIGVQRAQISRIESGKNLTFSTIARVFKAMGISAKLEIGNLGKVALW
ncbi:helix-turn-helix domain-containing protein [Bacteroides uniformis]|uniref:helix-turn-helix domain-containing protein n=1 Tax=Bacteroidaceae TaxID=815 RepID=UPI00374E1DC7